MDWIIIGSGNGLSAPSHCLDRFWHIVNDAHRSSLQWNSNQNADVFLRGNIFKHVFVPWQSFRAGPNMLNGTLITRSNTTESDILWHNSASWKSGTVFPASHAHNSRFLVFCCRLLSAILPASFRVTSQALGQSYDCPSASDVTLNDRVNTSRALTKNRYHDYNRTKQNRAHISSDIL